MKLFLLFYLLLYFFAAFFWRSYLVRRKTGINPVVLESGNTVHGFVGRGFKLLFAMTCVVVIVYSFSERLYAYLFPLRFMEPGWITTVGVVLLLASLAWIILAQAQMGESWRIGIDTENRTELVRTGVFKISRNPIFLGMMITLLGLFLVIPSVVTLLTLVLAVVSINVQVRLEEQYLARLHGESYEDYRQHVRRWI